MCKENRNIALVTLFLAIALGLTACGDGDINGPGDQRAQEPFSFAVDASSASGLRLDAVNGTINITGVTGGDSVFVDGEREVTSSSLSDAQARLSQIEVESEVLAGEVIIRTIQPDDTEGRNYTVNYEITVPRGFEVVVIQGNGIITIKAIENDVSLDQGNGIITLDGITGETFVDVGNGEIFGNVSLPAGGTIEWDLGNGIIDLEIPATTSANFSASVGTGAITTSGLQFQNQSTTVTSVTGQLGAGDGEISLSVGNGTITVRGS